MNIRGVEIKSAASTIAKHMKISLKQVVVGIDNIQLGMASQIRAHLGKLTSAPVY
jgi:hypothetical protein